MTPEQRVAKQLRDIATQLDQGLHYIAGEQMGFSLLVFPLGRLGEGRHVSNVSADSAASIMRQWLDSLKETVQ